MQATLRPAGATRTRPRRSARRPSLVAVLASVPLLLIAILVVTVLWMSFQRGIVGTAAASTTVENYRDMFADPFAYGSMLNTLVFALVTTLVALSIGLPIAWLAERTTIRGKPVVYAIMTLGLLVPGIYQAMGWTFIGHPRIGFLNQWLMGAFHLSFAPINVLAPPGMGFVQGLTLTPLAFILTVQVFRAMNPTFEEAARIHGLSVAKTLWRVTLPLALPGVLAAVIYIATIGIATFDVPAILGLGNRVYMLSTFVYTKSHPTGSGIPEYGVTAATGTFMIVVALLLTAWYSSVLRQGHRYQVVTGKGYRPTPIKLGRWNVVAWAFILGYALLSDVLPILLIALAAFSPFLAPPSMELLQHLSLVNFDRIEWGLVIRGLTNTLTLLAVVPLTVLLFGFCISWFVVRSRGRARYVFDFGSFLPHALPEIILAVGASLLALFVLGRMVPLYGSVWLIAIVYVVARLAFATRAFNSALMQIHQELEEVAFASGLSAVRTAWRVLLPILRPTMLSVWVWTVLLVYRELTVAAFLLSPSNITLPAVVWSYWFAGAQPRAAAVTLLMTAAVLPLLVVFWWFGRRSEVQAVR